MSNTSTSRHSKQTLESTIIDQLALKSGLNAKDIHHLIQHDTRSQTLPSALKKIQKHAPFSYSENIKYTEIFTAAAEKALQTRTFQTTLAFIHEKLAANLKKNLFFQDKKWVLLSSKTIFRHLKENGRIQTRPLAYLKKGKWHQDFTQTHEILNLIDFEKNLFQALLNEGVDLLEKNIRTRQTANLFQHLKKHPHFIHVLSDLHLAKKEVWASYLSQIEKTSNQMIIKGIL